MIRRFQAGDESAVHDLLQLHAGWIHRLKQRLGGNLADDDVESSIYIGCWLAARDFDLSSGHAFNTYLTWKIRGAISEARRRVGSVSREKLVRPDAKGRTIFEEQPSREEDAATQLDRAQVVHRVQRAIDRLPDRLAGVLRQRMAGVMARTIAQELGVTHQRVQQLERQARNRLRYLLRDLAA